MMTRELVPLFVLRHAVTEWNAERRIQGRTDIPLSAAGRAAALQWQQCLPADMRGWRWFASDRLRARETAALFGITPEIEPRIAEMSWGRWEGQRLADLVAAGDLSPALEALGLDFRPPDGESPRDLQARLRPWLAEVAATGRPTAAVTHHGVLRALLALATGWDMATDPPERLRKGHGHLFALTRDASLSVDRLNLPLITTNGAAWPEIDWKKGGPGGPVRPLS